VYAFTVGGDDVSEKKKINLQRTDYKSPCFHSTLSVQAALIWLSVHDFGADLKKKERKVRAYLKSKSKKKGADKKKCAGRPVHSGQKT
jgi:hypothetical protein